MLLCNAGQRRRLAGSRCVWVDGRGQLALGFSLTELLVAIAIIAVLVGLILVALGKARTSATRSTTLSTMQAFLSACQAFEIEHGFAPGIVPESVLAFSNHEIAHGAAHPGISSTENALLHLMGGYVLRDEVTQMQWDDHREDDGWVEFTLQGVDRPFLFKFNAARFGEGPIINGKPYKPYLTLSASDLTIADGPDYVQWPQQNDADAGSRSLPDLVDAWGTPILYFRRARTHGPIIGDAHAYAVKPQFYINSVWPYTQASTQAWSDPCGGGRGHGSIFYGNEVVAGQNMNLIPFALAQLLRHPSSGNVPVMDPQVIGTPRGSIVLVSAGPDRVYFSAADGPGSTKRPIGCGGCGDFEAYSYEDFLNEGRSAFETFDDIVLSGGG